MGQHILKHHITSSNGVFRMGDGIVESGSFQHADKDSSLICCDFFGCGVEICLCCGLDTKSIVAEVNSICILHKNLFLAFLASFCNSKI